MKYRSSMNQINALEVLGLLEEDTRRLIEMAEEEFHLKIRNVCRQIVEEQRHIILLTGPSSSGKTTTAKMIQKYLTKAGHHVHRISLDNFYLPREELPRWSDGYVNYESIEGLDIPYFNQLVGELKNNGRADFPIFDFATSARSERTFEVTMDEDSYVIFEGIHALNPKLSEHFDEPSKIMKIYVSVHSDFVDDNDRVLLHAKELRLIRRILRDNVHRGATPVVTLDMWEYVVRGEEEYIKPFRFDADYHINSAHAYEPFVYRQDLETELAPFAEHEKYGKIISGLAEKIKAFYSVDKALIPLSSLLKEFI